MRHILSILFILFLSVCVITGCSSPAGSILDDGSGDGDGNGDDNGNSRDHYDFLMLRPNRILYEVDGGADGRFDRSADLRVFVADDKGYRALDVNDSDLVLELIMNPGLAGESTAVLSAYFPFSEPGRHTVKGTYNDKTDEYSIEVRGTFVNPGDGSGFIGIEWQ